MDRWGLRVWAEGLVLHREREAASEMGKENGRWVQENVGEPKKDTEGPAVDEVDGHARRCWQNLGGEQDSWEAAGCVR